MRRKIKIDPETRIDKKFEAFYCRNCLRVNNGSTDARVTWPASWPVESISRNVSVSIILCFCAI